MARIVPEIGRVRKVVKDLYGRLERENKLEQTSFGVVGYRKIGRAHV